MGALTNLYVAATSGSDGTGTGASGNPYKTVQFALNNFGRDATNGNYVNISGVDVLAGSVSISTWGSPDGTAPTTFKDWSGGPDGRGGLDGNAANFTIMAPTPWVSFHGLILRNTGTAVIINLSQGVISGCEISNSSNAFGITTQYEASLIGNYIFDCKRIDLGPGASAMGNYYFDGPTNHPNGPVFDVEDTAECAFNIVTLATSVTAINSRQHSLIHNNSILATAALTSTAIDALNQQKNRIFNNLIEGFSGVGGAGIANAGENIQFLAHNAVFNCTTAYASYDPNVDIGNETLSASPFAKSGSNTFANRKVYFAPVNTGNVWGGAYPDSGLDKGAIQHAGGGAAPPNFNIIPQSA